MVDEQGCFLDANPVYCAMLGYSVEELRKISFPSITPEKWQTWEGEEIWNRRLMKDGYTDIYEKEYIRKDGHVFPVELQAFTVFDPNRNIKYVWGTVRDITERKLAEEALLKKNEELHAAYEELTASEEELRANLADLTRQELALREKEEKISLLLNSTAEAIYGLDMDGNCTFCNASCLRLLGYNSPDELLGRNMHWQIHAKYPDGTHFPVEECRIFQAFNKGEGTHVDDEVLWRSDGTSFPAEYWSYPQRRDGVVVGAVVTFLDITDRKRAEEALHKNAEELHAAYEELTASQEELRANLAELTRQERALRTFNAYNRSLLEASLDPLVTINHEGKIADVNLSTEKVTGHSREELIGTDFSDYFTEPAKANEGYQRVFTEGTVRDYPLNLRHRDGHITPVLYNASVYRDEAGNVSGVFAAARDITDRKVAEDALMRVNQKLNVLSQLTRKDLTNQTFVLSSYLELAKNQLTGQEHIIETVEKGAQAVRLIHETIAYSKDYQDMGAKPPKWQNVKMALLLGLSHISISEIQHSIETGDLEVFADPLLEKVCQRLFENSVKHGDHVTLIRVWHTVTPEGATIFFEDDGIGIPHEKKEQIFLRDESSARASMRSLIFVREILDITGITTTETGEPGKGARFEMTVPKGVYRENQDTDLGKRSLT